MKIYNKAQGHLQNPTTRISPPSHREESILIGDLGALEIWVNSVLMSCASRYRYSKDETFCLVETPISSCLNQDLVEAEVDT